MMRTNTVFTFAFLLCLFAACHSSNKEAGQPVIADLNPQSPDCDQYVLIETTMGNIKLKLYKDTPLHRKNFINLVKNGFYDGQLFFRVMGDFLVQAGDPKTKNAEKGAALGDGEVNYRTKAEIFPDRYYHKRGALSAASVSPMRESSGCQFYIITGKKVGASALDKQEKKIDKGVRKIIYEELQEPYKDEINNLYAESQKDKTKKKELSDWIHKFSDMADSVMAGRDFHYSNEQRELYGTVGGAAHLDGFYTVFGEVVEGIDVVEAISKQPIDVRHRPLTDVVIRRMTVVDE